MRVTGVRHWEGTLIVAVLAYDCPQDVSRGHVVRTGSQFEGHVKLALTANDDVDQEQTGCHGVRCILSGRLCVLLQLFGRLDDDRSCHRSNQDQRNEDNHCTDTNRGDVVALFVRFFSFHVFHHFFVFSPASAGGMRCGQRAPP